MSLANRTTVVLPRPAMVMLEDDIQVLFACPLGAISCRSLVQLSYVGNTPAPDHPAIHDAGIAETVPTNAETCKLNSTYFCLPRP